MCLQHITPHPSGKPDTFPSRGRHYLCSRISVPCRKAIVYVFPRTCAGEKHDDPPVLPQQNGETRPAGRSLFVEEKRIFSDSILPLKGKAFSVLYFRLHPKGRPMGGLLMLCFNLSYFSIFSMILLTAIPTGIPAGSPLLNRSARHLSGLIVTPHLRRGADAP